MNNTVYEHETSPTTAVVLVPSVLCRRCGERCRCERPEVSGAVSCPTCKATAVLSRADAERVSIAARYQLRHGTYNDRYLPQRSPALRWMALDRDAADDLVRCAGKFLANASTTCPDCLYDLSGVLTDDEITCCPECGAETSRGINTVLWGGRAKDARLSRGVALWAGTAIAACCTLTIALSMVADTLATFMVALSTTLLLMAPFVVPSCAYTWLRDRNPTRPYPLLLLQSLGILAMQAAICLGLLLIPLMALSH